MKKRFSVEQIVAVLKQAELGLPVSDLTRKVGISEQTFYRRKKQYAGLESDQVREFEQLSEENARLKRLVAELSLDKAVLQDVLSKCSPARAHEGGRSLRGPEPRLQPASGLFLDGAAPFHAAQAEPTRSAAGRAAAHARDRGHPGPLRLSAHPRPAAQGRLGAGAQRRVAALPGRRAGAAQ
jgi:putative transposase